MSCFCCYYCPSLALTKYSQRVWWRIVIESLFWTKQQWQWSSRRTLKVACLYFWLLRFLTVSFLVLRSVSQRMPHPTKSLYIHYTCSSSDGHSYFEISKSYWLFATSLWRHPVPTIRHDKYCHRLCKNSKSKGTVHPLYRHWGSVQALRPLGGVVASSTLSWPRH